MVPQEPLLALLSPFQQAGGRRKACAWQEGNNLPFAHPSRWHSSTNEGQAIMQATTLTLLSSPLVVALLNLLNIQQRPALGAIRLANLQGGMQDASCINVTATQAWGLALPASAPPAAQPLPSKNKAPGSCLHAPRHTYCSTAPPATARRSSCRSSWGLSACPQLAPCRSAWQPAGRTVQPCP